MLVRDFESLGRVEGDGQILKVRLDSGHGEDSVDRLEGLVAKYLVGLSLTASV